MNTQNMWWTGKTYDLLDPALPAIFHDVQLGIGTRFIDDPTAASVKQAGVYQTSQQPRLNRFTGYRRGLRGNL